MTTIGSASPIAASGLEAASTRFDVSAARVAGTSQPRNAIQSEAVSGGVQVTLSPAAQQTSGDGLQSFIDQTTASSAYRANLRTLATAQDTSAIFLWDPPISGTAVSGQPQ